VTRDDEVTSQDSTQNAQGSQGGATPTGPETKGMKRVENPHYPAFDLLLARLLAHEEVLGLLAQMIPSDGESAARFAAWRADTHPTANPLQGCVADICEMQKGGFVRWFPTLRYPKRTKEARLHVNRTFRRRCCGWIVAETYESFREFAQEVDPATLMPQSAWKRLVEHVRVCGPLPCKRTRNRRDLKHVLKRIRKTAPALRDCENLNSRGVELSSWLRVLADVRNAVVHNGEIIAERRYRRLKSAGLDRFFPGEHIADEGYVLDLTPEVAQDSIERVREYGLAIYKAVSAAAEYPVTLYDPDKGMTVWRR